MSKFRFVVLLWLFSIKALFAGDEGRVPPRLNVIDFYLTRNGINELSGDNVLEGVGGNPALWSFIEKGVLGVAWAYSPAVNDPENYQKEILNNRLSGLPATWLERAVITLPVKKVFLGLEWYRRYGFYRRFDFQHNLYDSVTVKEHFYETQYTNTLGVIMSVSPVKNTWLGLSILANNTWLESGEEPDITMAQGQQIYLGYKAGIIYRPLEGLVFSLAYFSGIDRTVRIEPEDESSSFRMRWRLPAQLAYQMKGRILPALWLHIALDYRFWSDVDPLYKNSLNLAANVSYGLFEYLNARAGVFYWQRGYINGSKTAYPFLHFQLNWRAEKWRIGLKVEDNHFFTPREQLRATRFWLTFAYCLGLTGR